MSTTRERMEARAAKRRQWAEARARKTQEAGAAAATLLDQIPLGQPILVDHYSARKHRSHVARLDRAATAAADHAQAADSHRSKAETLERNLSRSVYSDDPDAVDRLRQKAAEITETLGRFKAAGALWRKRPGDWDAITAAGHLSDEELAWVKRTVELAPWTKAPFNRSNLAAELRRIRKRIDELSKQLTEA